MDQASSSHQYSYMYGPPLLPRPQLPHQHLSTGTYENTLSPSWQAPYRSSQIHRRSCIECGRRKVRCDRHQPCANCVKAQAECVFPKSRKPPTRSAANKSSSNRSRNRGRDEELLKSLQRLQRRLQETTEDADADIEDSRGDYSPERPDSRPNNRAGDGHPQRSSFQVGTGQSHSPTAAILDDETPGKSEESARLVLDHDHDRSRYISNSFWASMSREIEEMRDILDGSSSEAENDGPEQEQNQETTPASQISSRDSFIFSPMASSQSLQSLYPSSADLLAMFDIFLENVDPVVRIFHRPTLRSTIAEALPLLSSGASLLDRHAEVVIFSICYAALTSLDDADCPRLFNEERRVLLPRYRYAVEQSLARSRFLDSRNLAILASLVLFLTCVRRHDNSQFVSSLLGVVLRNAQAMGLHRDGTTFGLSPYETEMRRRLWWHICVLDIRASEDHGCDPSIYEQNYDTKFPLNINDEDISPKDEAAPEERSACSDMTFCLLRFEVSVAVRKLNYPAPIGSKEPGLSIAQKRAYVEDVEKMFHSRYIKHCDITKPFDWVSASWARLMLAKLWLAASNPLLFRHGGGIEKSDADALPGLRNAAFEKSIEVLELSDQLETGHRASRWRWLFLTHVQWHAVVFVLAHLCARPTDDDELSRRAERMVDRVCGRWPVDGKERKGMLWKPIRKLVDRAHQIRSKGLSGRMKQAGQATDRPRLGDDAKVPEMQTGNPSGVITGNWQPQPGTLNDGHTQISATETGGYGGNKTQLTSAVDFATSTNAPTAGNFGQQHQQQSGFLDMAMPSSTMDSFSDPQTSRSDWSDTLQELQLIFQDNGEGGFLNAGDAMEGYGNLWSTL